MEYESRAISLIYHKYGEGAVIAKVFTEELGLKSYSIKRSSSKKSKNKISLLANQSLLNIRGKENKKREATSPSTVLFNNTQYYIILHNTT